MFVVDEAHCDLAMGPRLITEAAARPPAPTLAATAPRDSTTPRSPPHGVLPPGRRRDPEPHRAPRLLAGSPVRAVSSGTDDVGRVSEEQVVVDLPGADRPGQEDAIGVRGDDVVLDRDRQRVSSADEHASR